MLCDIMDMHLFESSKVTRFTTTKKERPHLRDGSFYISKVARAKY